MALYSIDCPRCKRLVYVEAEVILPHLLKSNDVKMEVCGMSGKPWKACFGDISKITAGDIEMLREYLRCQTEEGYHVA